MLRLRLELGGLYDFFTFFFMICFLQWFMKITSYFRGDDGVWRRVWNLPLVGLHWQYSSGICFLFLYVVLRVEGA